MAAGELGEIRTRSSGGRIPLPLPRVAAGAGATAIAYLLASVDVVPLPVGLAAAVSIGLVAAAVSRETAGHLDAGLTPVDGWRILELELNRARRHERPLVISRIPVPADAASSAEALRALVLDRIRASDHVWLDGDDLLFVLPETDRAAADAWLDRVLAAIGRSDLAAISASFPQDGVTTGALVSVLFGRPVGGHTVAVARRPIQGVATGTGRS